MIFNSPYPTPEIPGDNLTKFVFKQAKKSVFGTRPDTPVFIDAASGESISFTETEDMTYKLAAGMQKILGIKPGMTVGVYSTNDVYALPMFYSTALIGGILVPTFPQAPVEVLAHRLRMSPPHCMFTTYSLLPIVREAIKLADCPIPENRIVLIRGGGGPKEDIGKMYKITDLMINEECEPYELNTVEESKNAVLVIPHTSGSTGKPKGMVIPHHSFISLCTCELKRDKYLSSIKDPKDLEPRSVLFTLFQTQAYGLYFSAVENVCRGLTTVEGKMFDIQNVLRLVEEYRAVEIRGIPKIYYDWIDNWEDLKHYDISSLKGMYSTGIIFAPQMKRRLEELTGVLVSSEYGTSETMGVARNVSFDKKDYCVGTLYTGIQLKVIDKNGKILGPNNIGEVCVKTLTEMHDYLMPPQDNDGKVTNKPIRDEDGFFYTGDMGEITEDGLLCIYERVKDTIQGENGFVFPSVIENKMQAHPSIDDVVILGVDVPSKDGKGVKQAARAFIVPPTAITNSSDEEKETYLKDLIEWANKDSPKSERLDGGAQLIDPLPIPRGDKGRHLIVRMRYLADYKPEEPIVASMISPLPGLEL
ncbi:hypothetical protein H4219_000553 [Mycoemilia scoparia]|uniref:AMP-dependent synthetase/ligase domain-containing protein n=1 Tax=Mycoemilia scoparia TaxID=417184 RepID=A0A9W8DWS5_9FUNG|nr:hypothetical protein H4219_000553 [Mycoemilia scoparia]